MSRSAIRGALLLAPILQHQGRLALSVLAIALGVALGYAVQLVNQAAINEFAAAVQTLFGEADLAVRGPRAGSDESLYPRIASLPEVAVASPVLELDARLPGRRDALKILGLDIFRAAQIQPFLAGGSAEPDRSAAAPRRRSAAPRRASGLRAAAGHADRAARGRRRAHRRAVARLPRQSQRARAGGAVYRRTARFFGAGTCGGAPALAARAASRARRDAPRARRDAPRRGRGRRRGGRARRDRARPCDRRDRAPRFRRGARRGIFSRARADARARPARARAVLFGRRARGGARQP